MKNKTLFIAAATLVSTFVITPHTFGAKNSWTAISTGDIYNFINNDNPATGSVALDNLNNINDAQQILLTGNVNWSNGIQWFNSWDYTGGGLMIDGGSAKHEISVGYYYFSQNGTHNEFKIHITNINFVASSTTPKNWVFGAQENRVYNTINFNFEGTTIKDFQTNYGLISQYANYGTYTIDGGVNGVVFSNNTSAWTDAGYQGGGAITVHGIDSQTTLNGKHEFTGNYSNTYGGAIEMQYGKLSTDSGADITFTANRAQRFGGALNAWGGSDDAAGLYSCFYIFNGKTTFNRNSGLFANFRCF